MAIFCPFPWPPWVQHKGDPSLGRCSMHLASSCWACTPGGEQSYSVSVTLSMASPLLSRSQPGRRWEYLKSLQRGRGTAGVRGEDLLPWWCFPAFSYFISSFCPGPSSFLPSPHTGHQFPPTPCILDKNSHLAFIPDISLFVFYMFYVFFIPLFLYYFCFFFFNVRYIYSSVPLQFSFHFFYYIYLELFS